MAETTVVVHGEKQLAATLAAAGNKIGHMDSAHARVGASIAQRARGAAPKRTGRLARSTTARPTGNGASVTATVVYARVIHNGWARHNISPNPYIQRTMTQYSAEWADQYAAEVQKILGTVKGA